MINEPAALECADVAHQRCFVVYGLGPSIFGWLQTKTD